MPVALIHGFEAARHVRLRVVDLDQARGLEDFLCHPGYIAHRVLDPPPVAPEVSIDHRHEPAHQRSHQQRQHRQPHVGSKQHYDETDDRDARAHDRRHRIAYRLPDLLGVEGELGQHLP